MPTKPNAALAAEFQSLIDRGCGENELQTFLEKNSQFLPEAHLLSGLHCNCVVSKLPITNRVTDFAYVTKNTNEWRLVLIELERADKKIFVPSSNYNEFSKAMNQALSQIEQWEQKWERSQNEVVELIRPLLIPKHMATNRITPYYVLIIGRRAEYEGNEERKDRLSKLNVERRIQVMTYDTLLREYNAGRGSKRCILTPGKRYKIKSVQGLPEHLFAHLGPSELTFSASIKEKLKSSGYEIEEWLKGKKLSVGGRSPFRKKDEDDYIGRRLKEYAAGIKKRPRRGKI